jgi:hypothetical protein
MEELYRNISIKVVQNHLHISADKNTDNILSSHVLSVEVLKDGKSIVSLDPNGDTIKYAKRIAIPHSAKYCLAANVNNEMVMLCDWKEIHA